MKVAIVIPTRNGMPLFREVLDAVLGQRCRLPFELFCIDSESDDGTFEELERRGIRSARIRRRDFNHGATRNQGFAACDGDLLVSTVQDATPADDQWLERLVEAVLQRDDVAGAYSRQLPRPGINPLLERRLAAWAAGRAAPRLQALPAGSRLADLPPMEQLLLCAFDDVSSIMRRSVWRRLPLPARAFGEDVAWGREVIRAGLAIAYEPRSVVIHSHDVGPVAEFRRIYLDHKNLCELFGLVTVPTLRAALRSQRSQRLLYRDLLREMALPAGQRRRLERFARNYALAETMAQWLGARAVHKGPARGLFRWIEAWAAGH